MKKLSFILTLLLIIGCEEEDGEKSLLVGTWTMTKASGGVYVMVNKTQYVRMGDVDGEITSSLYDELGLTRSYSMNEINVSQNMDGTFIDVMKWDDVNQADINYMLADYVSSLNDYDFSQLNVSSMDEDFSFSNESGNFIYSLETDDNGMHTVTISNDTLYRAIYINGEMITDSSRYGIVSGTIKEVGTQVQANQKISMMDDDIGLPDALTLTLNADFTGTADEAFQGFRMVSDIRWYVTPDSLFGWEYCGLDGDDDECEGGPEFNTFKVTENSLDIGMYQDMCQEYDTMDGSGYCDDMMYYEYGVEMGTLDSYWAEINVSMVKSNSSKQHASTNQNLKLNNRSLSIFQEIAKQKRHIKNKRSVK